MTTELFPFVFGISSKSLSFEPDIKAVPSTDQSPAEAFMQRAALCSLWAFLFMHVNGRDERGGVVADRD